MVPWRCCCCFGLAPDWEVDVVGTGFRSLGPETVGSGAVDPAVVVAGGCCLASILGMTVVGCLIMGASPSELSGTDPETRVAAAVGVVAVVAAVGLPE